MKKFNIFFILLVFTVFSMLSAGDTANAQQNASTIAEWTILSYLSADNDLEKNAIFDINEMEAVGPAPGMNIIVQLDRQQSGYNDGVNIFTEAARLKIQKDDDQIKITSPVVMKLGPNINSGDPNTLSAFIEWGIKNYPAKRYMLCIWSHGSGWKTISYDNISRTIDEITKKKYKNARTGYLQKLNGENEYFYNCLKSRPSLSSRNITSLQTSKIISPQYSRSLKFNLDDDLLFRSISYDDTSRRSITLNELRDSIMTGCQKAGLPNGLDIIWFDACLMDMLEVGFAISDCAKYMVASEEITPDFGWNHTKLVSALNRNLAAPTDQIAKLLVTKFVDAYQKSEIKPLPREDAEFLPVTMSALNLEKITPITAAMNDLVKLASNPAYIPAIRNSLENVQRFDDSDYIDLLHFLELLGNRIVSPAFQTAISNLKIQLSKAILISKNNSPKFKNARGMSIYFPVVEYKEEYDKISFSNACNWKNLIKNVLYPAKSELIIYSHSSICNASGDGRLSPNDSFELRVTVNNVGDIASKNSNFKLTTNKNNGIKILSAAAAAPAIAPEDFHEITFKCSSGNIKIGQKVNFDLYLETDNGSSSVKLTQISLEARPHFDKATNALIVYGLNDTALLEKYTEAFNELSVKFDSWCIATDGAINLQILEKYLNGGVVFRIVPDSSISNKITREEVKILESFLKKGGALCLSGQDIGQIIGDTNLYSKFFKCQFLTDNGGTDKLIGSNILEGKSYELNGADSLNNQLFIDDIVPLAGADVILNYNTGKAAAVYVNDGRFRVMYFAFGLEAVTGIKNRAEIIAKALELLPFKLSDALNALRKDTAAKASEKQTDAVLATIELTEKTIIEDISNEKYDSALSFCEYFSKLATGERDAFKPLKKSIENLLKSKLVQTPEMASDKAEKINSILNKLQE